MNLAMQKRVFGHMRESKASAQSDQGIHCQLAESLDITEYKKESKGPMIIRAFALYFTLCNVIQDDHPGLCSLFNFTCAG